MSPKKAQSQHLCYERQSTKRNEGISNSYPRSLSATTHALAATGVGRNIWNLQNFFSTLRLTAQLLGLGLHETVFWICASVRVLWRRFSPLLVLVRRATPVLPERRRVRS